MKRDRILGALMGTGSLKIASLVLSFAASIVLARHLGPELLGMYTLVMSVIGVAAIPIGQGLTHYTVREVSIYFHKSSWALLNGLKHRLSQWSILVVIFLVAISLLFSDLIDPGSVIDVKLLIHIGALLLLLTSFSALRSSMLRGLGRGVIAQIPELVVRPAIFLIAILVLWLNKTLTLEEVLFSQLLAYCLAYILGVLLIRKVWPVKAKLSHREYDTSAWSKGIFHFILLIFLASLNKELGIFALGVFSSVDEVAFLRIAQNLGVMVGIFLTVVNIAIAPDVSKAFSENNQRQLEEIFFKARRVLALFTIVAGIILLSYNKEVIGFFFGNVYVETVSGALMILVAGHMISAIFGPVFLFYIMSKHERHAVVASVIMLAVNLIMQSFLAKNYGSFGAAIATSTAMILWNFYLAVSLSKKTGFRFLSIRSIKQP